MVVFQSLIPPGKGSPKTVKFEEPETCPLCKHAIKPHQLHVEIFSDNNDKQFITAHYLCKHCYQSFVTLAAVNPGNLSEPRPLLYCGPSKHKAKVFSNELTELSPRFVEIYNQALAAEELGLDQICGIGYRKALEFLIKDYLIDLFPEKQSQIEGMFLGKCISEMVDNTKLQTVASRCAWLGNDEAHYYKKFDEYDIETLKALLEATVYWVSMNKIADLAAQIESRR